MRHRAVAVILLLVVAAAAVGGVVVAGHRTHHGTGNLNVKAPSSASTSRRPSLTQVRLCQSCAYGYNPLGSPSDEHPRPAWRSTTSRHGLDAPRPTTAAR